jgi:hypothetical protein
MISTMEGINKNVILPDFKSALRLNESCVRLSLFVRKKHRVHTQLDIWATVLP